MFDRIHPEDRKSVEAQIRSAENSGQPWSQTFRVVLPEAGLHGLDAELRSLSQGLANFTATFDHLAELGGKQADEVVKAQAGLVAA